MESFPVPPVRVSAPAPPEMVEAKLPTMMTSSPSEPVMLAVPPVPWVVVLIPNVWVPTACAVKPEALTVIRAVEVVVKPLVIPAAFVPVTVSETAAAVLSGVMVKVSMTCAAPFDTAPVLMVTFS
jgi:hypothetical protein